MDSLANYGSDGDNSNNSDDTKMPCSEGSEARERRASDANYDPVQMDMSEESNNNNMSDDSESERASSPSHDRQSAGSRRDSSHQRSSPTDQRRSDHESHSSSSRDDHHKRTERNERCGKESSTRSRRSSHDDHRRNRDKTNDHSRDSRDSKKSRDDEKKSSRHEERKRDRKSSSSRDEKRSEDRDHHHHHHHHHHHRDERRARERDRSERSYRRDRERRQSREERTKERHREERSSTRGDNNKEKEARSRSRSKERVPPPPPPPPQPSFRIAMGRNKLAQLEKLGIELKAPVGEPVLPTIIGEPNYYNPLATATQGKYAEQIQKRKLLWANKSKQDEGKVATGTSNVNTWMGTTFTHDQDGKVTAKFKRLMGIKEDTPIGPQPANKPDILKKQEEMFNNMEQQYEVARATTHTQRGVGLGYASGGYQFPR